MKNGHDPRLESSRIEDNKKSLMQSSKATVRRISVKEE